MKKVLLITFLISLLTQPLFGNVRDFFESLGTKEGWEAFGKAETWESLGKAETWKNIALVGVGPIGWVYLAIVESGVLDQASSVGNLLIQGAADLEKAPNELKEGVLALEQQKVPETLADAGAKLKTVIDSIQVAEQEIAKQKKDIIAKNLSSLGLSELSELEQKLLGGLNALENALKKLVVITNNQCSQGVLCNLMNVINQRKASMIITIKNLKEKIDNELYGKIYIKDFFGRPLPDRMRGTGEFLKAMGSLQ